MYLLLEHICFLLGPVIPGLINVRINLQVEKDGKYPSKEPLLNEEET